MYIVYYLNGISLTNAWLYYPKHKELRRVQQKEIMRLLDFQLSIAYDVCHSYMAVPQAKKGRPSLTPAPRAPVKPPRRPPAVPDPSNESCYDKFDQFLEYMYKQGRCRLCPQEYSHLKCTKFRIPLFDQRS